MVGFWFRSLASVVVLRTSDASSAESIRTDEIKGNVNASEAAAGFLSLSSATCTMFASIEKSPHATENVKREGLRLASRRILAGS